MAKDSYYDKDSADYAVSFIESLRHTKGQWYREPFELIDWQEQIVRDVFGVLKPNGYRQFNTAYVEIPRKWARASWLRPSHCCSPAATVKNAPRSTAALPTTIRRPSFQCRRRYGPHVPGALEAGEKSSTQKRLIYQPTSSFYQVLSADVANKHGFNTHGVIFDELHTQPNRKLYDVMTKGSGDARMQPLYFLITTAWGQSKQHLLGGP